MGEIADMMVDGLLCQQCGVYLDGEEPGFPRYCADCNPEPCGYFVPEKNRTSATICKNCGKEKFLHKAKEEGK